MVSKAFFELTFPAFIHNTDFNFIFSIQRFTDFGKIIGIKSIDMFFVVSFFIASVADILGMIVPFLSAVTSIRLPLYLHC